MTCEIIVMNKRGLALAADSAVTVGDREKIYHRAEKLFPLASITTPVAIMTYGCADMTGVPWEVIIKMYSEMLGDRRFDRLEDYAQDFFRFIKHSRILFPAARQRKAFYDTVFWYWDHLKERAQRLSETQPKKMTKTPEAILLDMVHKEINELKRNPHLKGLGRAFGTRVLNEYGPVLRKLEGEVFGQGKLSRELRNGLRTAVALMYTRRWGEYWFPESDLSGVVIAGMGRKEPFPVFQEYYVGAMAAGKLQYIKNRDGHVEDQDSACVAPFAQRDVIDMFYQGIHPHVKEIALSAVAKNAIKPSSQKNVKLNDAQVKKLTHRVADFMEHEIWYKYTRHLIDAIDALPRADLATMAEALVNLTILRHRASLSEDETVGGPIDVALLSKGEGFTWIRRKSQIPSSTSEPPMLE
jgi:hypothetical protein